MRIISNFCSLLIAIDRHRVGRLVLFSKIAYRNKKAGLAAFITLKPELVCFENEITWNGVTENVARIGEMNGG